MSPEQARGQTGRQARRHLGVRLRALRDAHRHARVSRRDGLGCHCAILEREPDWSALPSAPRRQRCSGCCDAVWRRIGRQRLRDIGDAQRELEDHAGVRTKGAAAGPRRTRGDAQRRWRHRSLPRGSLAAVGWHRFTRDDRDGAAGHPDDSEPGRWRGARHAADDSMPLALSPDGRRLAYVARRDGRNQLHIRDLDAFEAKLLPDTEGARHPFFSPDGQSIAFFAGGKLKRVSILGGAPVAICDAPVNGHAGTWSSQGIIVFDPGASGLMQVEASGGVAERSHEPRREKGRGKFVVAAFSAGWTHVARHARTRDRSRRGPA